MVASLRLYGKDNGYDASCVSTQCKSISDELIGNDVFIVLVIDKINLITVFYKV